MSEESLTPRQQEFLERVIDYGGPRPLVNEGLGRELRATLEEAVATLPLDRVAPALMPLRIRKSTLSTIHACEESYLLDALEDDWSWNVAKAKGTVAHMAIQLWAGGFRGTNLELVGAATRVIADEPGHESLTEFLDGLEEGPRALLTGDVVRVVTAFRDDWPLATSHVVPIAERPVAIRLAGGRISVRAKVDLTFGQARRVADGIERRALFVELKSGGEYLEDHRHDAFLCALLAQFRLGAAPYRVVTWYLDSGNYLMDVIDDEVLLSTNRRLIEGIRKAVEVGAGRTANRRGNWRCRFCMLADDCDQAAHRRRAS